MPLTWLTLAADHALWGLNPFGYHLTNVLLHAANAVLFFWIALRLLPREAGAPLAAAAAALFFALHPLRVESVAWVTERRDVLSALFLLFCVLAYGERGARPEAGSRLYLASLFFFSLSLLCKSSGMMLPLVLLALDLHPLRASGSPPVRRIVEKIPFFAFSAFAAATAFRAQEKLTALWSGERYTWKDVLTQPGYRIFFYLQKTAAPFGLSPFYPYVPAADFFDPPFLAAAIGVLTLSAAIAAGARRRPGLATAWLIHLILLVPYLGLVQFGNQIAADRFTYLSSLPLAVLFGALAGRIARVDRRLVALPLFLPAGLGVLTFQQCLVWKDSMTLWTHALRLDPQSHIAWRQRGEAQEERGDLDGAWSDYSRAIELEPQKIIARLKRGTLGTKLGRWEEAERDFAAALPVDPNYSPAVLLRGRLRERMGRIAEAASDYEKALQLRPRDLFGHLRRGALQWKRGDERGARQEFEFVLRHRKITSTARMAEGHLLAMQGDLAGAIRAYGQALSLEPNLVEAYYWSFAKLK